MSAARTGKAANGPRAEPSRSPLGTWHWPTEMGTTETSTSPGPSSGLRALVPEPRPGPREWLLPPSWASGCSDKRMEESPPAPVQEQSQGKT